jgi:hypothetical protein
VTLDDAALGALAERHGTPLYAYDGAARWPGRLRPF